MEPNFDISPGLFENNDQFTGPFFDKYKLRKADAPLPLDHGISKDYLFPTFYADVTCAMGIFFCDYAAAQAMMPHPSMRPVPGTRGRAIVAFSCYEYKKVLGIPAYNEIAMTIPVTVDDGYNPPLLPLVMKSFTKQGYYVFSMPVTSYENQLRGNKIWGLPKVTERIDIDIANGRCTTTAYDEQGNNYFELQVPTQGKDKHFNESGYLYSVLDGKRLKSQTNFQGDFKMTMNAGRIFSKGGKSDTPWLKLGDSPRAEALRKLQLEEIPFQFRFCPSMSACFDLAVERI